MRWMRISSAANPAIKEVKRLVSHLRFCKETRKTIAEGIHLARELIGRKDLVLKVFLREGAQKNLEISQLLQCLEPLHVPCLEINPSLFNEISPVENGAGILCEIQIPDDTKLIMGEDIVYLDGVQDPGNVGTIIRAALASGVHNFAASTGTAFFWSPKVLRAAMGAHFYSHFVIEDDPGRLKAQTGNVCLVADANGGKSLYELPRFSKSILWIFGSEGQGVSPACMNSADHKVFIPINPQVESLNVAMAATVCLFERKRVKEVRDASVIREAN